MKIFLIVICLFFAGITGVYGTDSQQDFSKGPLFGKNMYIPFLIHYSFPSLSARSGQRHDLQYHISTYYSNDFQILSDQKFRDNWTERVYDTGYLIRDYESMVLEFGLDYNLIDNLQMGITMRMFSYFGGFLDPIMEGYHNLFGFINAGREFFLQNKLHINIPNSNGIHFFLDEPVISFGDIDLWCKWTFFERKQVSLAALGALKLPTGNLSTLSGSGHADIAVGLLMDYRAWRFATFFTQAGVVLPFNGKSHPMFNGLLGFEIHPWERWSFLMQMNIKTSPISDGIFYKHGNPVNISHYSKPQTNVLAGMIFKYNNFSWQFYIEEDAITNQGTDVTFNIMFSHSINLKRN